jgi:hypothetical protein
MEKIVNYELECRQNRQQERMEKIVNYELEVGQYRKQNEKVRINK